MILLVLLIIQNGILGNYLTIYYVSDRITNEIGKILPKYHLLNRNIGDNLMNVGMRKIQKSKTGWYINLPKKLIEELEITGDEFAKISKEEGSNRIIIDFVKFD